MSIFNLKWWAHEYDQPKTEIKPQNTTGGLTNFHLMRIEAMGKKLAFQELENDRLRTFLIEVCDKDCPEEYKRVVIKEALER